ncbi:hypothetical protein [Chamaesiphon polymorphus]|uniref:Uncharacterized protein n=1 Tax=Chamaesiphon polymorphus CCALA 037 TaxID=2107692 RepID=A0A2T1GBK0_9CYAN|nr:hypothetical protein [Chamaesiphon polymorphus]PSB54621.1 hypothetical protein C7B77_17625 [Chamaesiphon polymorphus CCALA 037]
MTAQIRDKISIDNQKYAIEQRSNWEVWFEPATHGIVPDKNCSTGCYRGFYCHYAIKEDRLFLKEIRDRFIHDRVELLPNLDFSIYDLNRQILAEVFQHKY